MPTNRSSTQLDPRSPLVVDVRQLSRRAGSQQVVERSVPAPPDLGTVMIGVPAGARLDLQLRLESVVEGVLVTGHAEVPLAGECGRCLDPVISTLEVDWQELYAYQESAVTEDEGSRLNGDFLDLEPALRDAVVLALPLTPLCRDDCPGLCAECGARLADVGPEHRHEIADPRWTALQQWTTDAPPDEE